MLQETECKDSTAALNHKLNNTLLTSLQPMNWLQ